MKRVVLVLGALAVAAFAANNVQLDRPLYIPGNDAQLSYDDGSANWLTWGGLYRGVWFNVTDFGTTGTWESDNTEYWFYHHSSYPWDTASFYGEIYNGDVSTPATLLDQTSVTATHYAAVYANYSSPVITEEQFWVLINTEMSGGGWPSVLGDPTYSGTDHSFFSDDFIVWEPWGMGDYFIRTTGEFALNSETWGAIKALYN